MPETLTLVGYILFGEIPRFAVVAITLSLIVSSIGFGRPPWFFGVGSGLAVGAMAAATGLAYRHRLGLLAGIQLAVLIVHGTWLSAFLITRERKPSFPRGFLARHTALPMRLGRRALVWLAVSLLYFCLFTPALYATVDRLLIIRPVTTALQISGLSVMLAGFVLELAADTQKSMFKAYQPDACCYAGLYGWVRQPNHLGELLFWAGNFIAGMGFFISPMHWLLAVAGLIGVLVLMGAIALRLEESRADRYGQLEEYRQYVTRVPTLIPWMSPRRLSPGDRPD